MRRHDKVKEYAEFIIDETFGVPGVGTVIAGTVKRGVITTNANLMLGPDVGDGTFKPTAIKSIQYKRLPVTKVLQPLLSSCDALLAGHLPKCRHVAWQVYCTSITSAICPLLVEAPGLQIGMCNFTALRGCKECSLHHSVSLHLAVKRTYCVLPLSVPLCNLHTIVLHVMHQVDAGNGVS